MSPSVTWLIRLTCCGRDEGLWFANTWDEADRFREDYIATRGAGHSGSAIIVRGPRAAGPQSGAET